MPSGHSIARIIGFDGETNARVCSCGSWDLSIILFRAHISGI